LPPPPKTWVITIAGLQLPAETQVWLVLHAGVGALQSLLVRQPTQAPGTVVLSQTGVGALQPVLSARQATQVGGVWVLSQSDLAPLQAGLQPAALHWPPA